MPESQPSGALPHTPVPPVLVYGLVFCKPNASSEEIQDIQQMSGQGREPVCVCVCISMGLWNSTANSHGGVGGKGREGV